MWLGSSFCCWRGCKPGDSNPAASRAETSHLEGDSGHFGEGMEAHDSLKKSFK